MDECETRWEKDRERLEQLAQEPLTKGKIQALSDSDLVYVVLGKVIDHLPEDTNRWRKALPEMSVGHQVVFLVSGVEGDVNNGGFHQYFFNQEEDAAEALRALRVLGATEHADLMERAIRTYHRELPLQRRVRRLGTLQALFGSYRYTKLTTLDDEFYALNESSALGDMLARYIREHPEEFIGL